MLTKSTQPSGALGADYFRIRDFEYAQPLYDLAFLLEVEALRSGQDVPKHRNFSLWKAAYRIDGYTALIDQWLDGKLPDTALDYVPSPRIRYYLEQIRTSGTLPELAVLEPERARQILKLRAVRGLGAKRIAEMLRENPTSLDASESGGLDLGPENNGVHQNGSLEIWQAAHVVAPLLRLLAEIENSAGAEFAWCIRGVKDGIHPVHSPFEVSTHQLDPSHANAETVSRAIARQPLFSFTIENLDRYLIQHQQGWSFWMVILSQMRQRGKRITQIARQLDPLTHRRSRRVRSDLHLHTSWSDGNSDIYGMAAALKKAGREYFAITDHSRSCKLQGGLTPVSWLRQAASLRAEKLPCPVLHGIEVDILGDGSLDLPDGLLAGMDLVIGSVHGNWSSNIEDNTRRLIRAIESGLIDIIGHPTSAVIGKPGVPNYCRPPASVDWITIFRHCSKWRVALELNCFPSRLDLALPALRQAVDAGCSISLGSDAHARSHLHHLRFGEQIIKKLKTAHVLNYLPFDELKMWLRNARDIRSRLPKTGGELLAPEPSLPNGTHRQISASLNLSQSVPSGSRIVGLDLTAGRGKASGVALLDGCRVKTTSLVSDDDILQYIRKKRPQLVSIDSPLGFPGGGTEIDSAAGIVRVAERDLSSVGVSAYPALIDSMRELTIRGINLKRRIEAMPNPPAVIESYPGAAQDILSIPRKQISLELLRNGLRRLGISGSGLHTRSHDEMDAITSAVVGRYFEAGQYEPMGIPEEAQLIVPKVRPLNLDPLPVICLSGRSGSGKSIIARYLALFYGFRWIRTRDVIRALLIDDIDAPQERKMFKEPVTKHAITEQTLRDFGIVVLEQYQQAPLRAKLMQIIADTDSPVVVDSVRDLVDVDASLLPDRAICLWYIDTGEARLRQRLSERGRQTGKTTTVLNPIDQKAILLRQKADCVISNNGTLEELRWQIDDTFFRTVNLRKPTE